ncbi:hypothetical protein Unana1_06358 [Umbelopsis nana]
MVGEHTWAVLATDGRRFMSDTAMTTIPQFVVIHDQARNTYKHPVVHYVFEDEAIPDTVPKTSCIIVDLNESATEVVKADSLDPAFQIINCRLDKNTSTEAGGFSGTSDDAELVNLTIDGVSAHVEPRLTSKAPLVDMDSVREAIFNFKDRNEMMRRVMTSQIRQ